MSEWQPIATAPKNLTRVDVWVKVDDTGAGYRVANAYHFREWWWDSSSGAQAYRIMPDPTHWMPLPEPPK